MAYIGSVLSLLVAIFSVAVCDPTGSRIGPCKYRFDENGTVIDLNPLASRDNTEWKFQTPLISGYYYYFSPCLAMKSLTGAQAVCNGALACQEFQKDPTNNVYILGMPNTEQFSIVNNQVVLSYSGITPTESTKNNRTSEITLICSKTSTSFTFVSEDVASLIYKFTLTAPECCPSGKGISFGTILCIVFIVALIVYILGGILINKFARGATGAELIPNRAFWADLPNLIKEGFQFTASKISGCFSRDSQYDQI